MARGNGAIRRTNKCKCENPKWQLVKANGKLLPGMRKNYLRRNRNGKI